jgi:hypothetical protein
VNREFSSGISETAAWPASGDRTEPPSHRRRSGVFHPIPQEAPRIGFLRPTARNTAKRTTLYTRLGPVYDHRWCDPRRSAWNVAGRVARCLAAGHRQAPGRRSTAWVQSTLPLPAPFLIECMRTFRSPSDRLSSSCPQPESRQHRPAKGTRMTPVPPPESTTTTMPTTTKTAPKTGG